MHFQRINVEEMLPVQRHPAEHGVEQRALHHVGVLAVGFHLQHAAGKHHQADGGAAFGIHGIVRQIVIAAEGFAAALGADPAGDIQLALGHVIPQAQAVLAFAFILAQAGEVRDAGHQVDEAHRVADCRRLFRQRLMRLAVGFILHHPRRAVGVPVGGLAAFFIFDIVEVRLRSALLDEVFHQRQIAGLLRDIKQAHQRQLDFRVAGIAMQLLLTRPKNAVDMVGQRADHLQQTPFAGALEVRHARFNHVPGAVELMAFRQVRPALARGFDREVSIQITIVALGGGHQLNHLVGGFFQFGIGFLAQGPGHRLQPFCYVAILKDHPVEFAALQSRCNAEVGDSVARLGLGDAVVQGIPLIGDHYIAHQLLIVAQKRVADFQFMQVGFHYEHRILLRTERDAGAGRWQCAPSLGY
ncbi:hypothetical protein D3C75_603440 [compost metagenome]